MKISELPRLCRALETMGLDNGANVTESAAIPEKWEMQCRIADDELANLSSEQIETLAMGEHSDQQVIAKLAPNADAILAEAFDAGELSEVFFKPWRNIYDARAAELKYQR